MYKPVDNFSRGVDIYFSDVQDGSVAAGAGKPPTWQHLHNAQYFFEKHSLPYKKRTSFFATYGPEHTYTDIVRADASLQGERFTADAVFTTELNQPITLTVADCVATVVHDPIAHMLSVLHLGRHSSVAGLIEEFAIRVADELGSDPRDWHVWMSPSIQKESNSMDYFEPPRPDEWVDWQYHDSQGRIHIDTPGHNRARFERAGVNPENIYVSAVDTYTDTRYFSHRAACELHQPDRQGRMMVVATLL